MERRFRSAQEKQSDAYVCNINWTVLKNCCLNDHLSASLTIVMSKSECQSTTFVV